jgi:hypothetical protein
MKWKYYRERRMYEIAIDKRDKDCGFKCLDPLTIERRVADTPNYSGHTEETVSWR